MEELLQIEHGVINTYVPIKFNYSDDEAYNTLIKKLENSDFAISEQIINNKDISLELKQKFLEINDSIVNTYINKHRETHNKEELKRIDKDTTIKFTYSDDGHIPSLKNKDSIVLNFVDIFFEVGIPKINMGFQSKIQTFVENQLNEIVNNTNESSQYFGPEMTLNKYVIMLWPIILYDTNDKKQLASVSLEFYEYGMAILKISFPIENQDSYPLFVNNTGLYYKLGYYIPYKTDEISIRNFDYKELSNCDISIVLKTIEEWIVANSESSIAIDSFLSTEIRELIQLNKLSPNNINLSTAKKEEIEAIYRIVNAPITDKQKFHAGRNIIWKEQFWGGNLVRYIFSTMGRCVAIAGNDLYKTLKDEDSEDDINEVISRSLLLNVETAYKIMLLNRLNSFSYLINQQDVNYLEYKLYEKDYYLAENYILSLLDFSYGSVRELYQKIEEICKDYLNKESLEQRFKNNERILNNQYKEKNSKENDILSVLGLMITVLVSFPSIYETLSIIQKEFITIDISGISVMGLSILLEVIFLIVLFIWYFKRSK